MPMRQSSPQYGSWSPKGHQRECPLTSEGEGHVVHPHGGVLAVRRGTR